VSVEKVRLIEKLEAFPKVAMVREGDSRQRHIFYYHQSSADQPLRGLPSVSNTSFHRNRAWRHPKKCIPHNHIKLCY
jgi:hypothetical protein